MSTIVKFSKHSRRRYFPPCFTRARSWCQPPPTSRHRLSCRSSVFFDQSWRIPPSRATRIKLTKNWPISLKNAFRPSDFTTWNRKRQGKKAFFSVLDVLRATSKNDRKYPINDNAEFFFEFYSILVLMLLTFCTVTPWMSQQMQWWFSNQEISYVFGEEKELFRRRQGSVAHSEQDQTMHVYFFGPKSSVIAWHLV